jgi:hypothetical protein
VTPHRQLITHNPEVGDYGDCHRTCIASIFDLAPEQVPHFCRGVDGRANPAWDIEERAWLKARGFAKSSFPFYATDDVDFAAVLATTAQFSRGVPMILGGQSSLGCNHSVVIMDGEIVSDPSGNGIVGPCDDGYFWVEVIAFASNSTSHEAAA